MELSFVAEMAIFLAAAVVAVPLTRRAGLGAVIGYLFAGVAIGPFGLRLIADVESILHFAEFGVVLLLFLIGLELQPRRLWTMRRQIAELGVGQMVITTIALTTACIAIGLSTKEAIVIALALSLSSTAFALQVLAEKNQLTTRHGRAAFSVLLLQDIAVIPILAILPLMGVGEAAPGWMDVAKGAGAVAALVVLGRYGLRYAQRVVAGARTHEVFLALSLLTVVSAALLMDWAGLSMGLGAFIAGVLLADSEYRHALEADIEPFKGLLLGLFFIAVGMSVNLGLLGEIPLQILGLVAALVIIKAVLLYGLGRRGGLAPFTAGRMAIVLSQGGEFAFVILSAAVGALILEQRTVDVAILVVSLSMLTTPFLYLAIERLEFSKKAAQAPELEGPVDDDPQVIIAGFGRFGQVVGRILHARKIGFTALETNPHQIDFVGRFGNKVYYGDTSRIDVLRAAGIEKAAAFVLAVDDVDQSLKTARVVRENFPNLPIYARARNRKHAYLLMDQGIRLIQRETFHSSLETARELLEGLGMSETEARRTVETFRKHDVQRLMEAHDYHTDEERMRYLAKKSAEELEELFTADKGEDKSDKSAAE
ncbi:MAG: monovalent cation:proton antiporter-2 (CPA2) family protein [Rhodovibrionaceae bacterium]|nr:monovalent cation:proton antiporter-2 (CPA2) family protein [Rhodovibrionaceae bacterium]